MKNEVVIKQDEKQPIAVEILAASIIELEKGTLAPHPRNSSTRGNENGSAR